MPSFPPIFTAGVFGFRQVLTAIYSTTFFGSPIRIACYLLLLAIQLVVGISHPSWIFLPFFVCSCVCLVDWSLTSNFLGLFRCRIPNKSTLYGQFLTSKISQINYLGFRLYRALPFLYELRCMLDWSCTTTSLTLYDWLKVEDIYSSLFLVKCDAVLNRASHKQGQKQSRMTKFCSGICLSFILICVIWAPMLMYSSGNPTNIANPIKDVNVQIDIKATGGRLTPFQTTLSRYGRFLLWFNSDISDL
ncbi:hypothetical protein KFK09_006125 [Dendrobium nobile]|uniref:Piezo THU9 and anchor domain-containing protein n=1 Tax=Dendrobium nobile TaxID=94219 RepID=A0A8T3BQT5_DENNO|nr:hypothetical protein KFK09_006125 [Dendrobium nobile]